MQSFVDETRIEVTSGHGGAGCVSFRREKYVPRGGPDGGDGGRGGDVIFRIQNNLKTLHHLKSQYSFKASNGQPGRGRKCHGKDGSPAVIPVPPGTLIKDGETGELYNDLTGLEDGSEWVFIRGGKGGLGNWHFRSSRKQSPRYAQPGYPGQTVQLAVELSLIADIGLVGFPSAGKSTLLKTLTNANPRIAPYPFTTKIPNLGVFRFWDRDIIIADIPGIIEGASHGQGLGFRFLRHITRTSCLAFLLDCSQPDPDGQFSKLCLELEEYDPSLLEKPRLLVGTKLDLDGAPESYRALKESQSSESCVGISSVENSGLDELKNALLEVAGR
jgi:GTP-binding protein